MVNTNERITLKEHPFWVLGVSFRSGRHEIVSAAEDRSFFMDPELCSRAQSILLNPAKRLAAEIDWFPDTDAATLGRITEALEADAPLPPIPSGPLSRLNRTVCAFSLLSSGDRDMLTAGIRELDRGFTGVDPKELTARLSQLRRASGFPLPELPEVEKELRRKRDQIRQLIGQKLSELPETACMSLMTFLAVNCIADEGYRDGAVLSDAVAEYDLRVRAAMDRHEEQIRRQLRLIEESDGMEEVSAALQKIWTELAPWAGLATPMNIRAQVSGVPYSKGSEMFRDLREMGVMLHNKKDMTEQSLEVITTLQRMFSPNAAFVEKLKKDEEALRKQLPMAKLLAALSAMTAQPSNALQQAVDALEKKAEEARTWPDNKILEKTTELEAHLTGLIRKIEAEAKDSTEARSLLEALVRHSRKINQIILKERRNPVFSLSLVSQLRRDLAKYPELTAQLDKDYEEACDTIRSRRPPVPDRKAEARAKLAQGQQLLAEGKQLLTTGDRRAVEVLTKAAHAGNTEAQKLLADIYREGCLVPKDMEASTDWLQKAAVNGRDPEAMFEYSRRLETGEGIVPSAVNARMMLFRAADAGLPEAIKKGAWVWENGEGRLRNTEKAFQYYLKGALLGDETCAVGAGRLSHEAKPEELRAAFPKLEQYPPRTPEVLTAYGRLYRQAGQEEDLRKAWICFQKAIRGGSEEAIADQEEMGAMMDKRYGNKQARILKRRWSR